MVQPDKRRSNNFLHVLRRQVMSLVQRATRKQAPKPQTEPLFPEDHLCQIIFEALYLGVMLVAAISFTIQIDAPVIPCTKKDAGSNAKAEPNAVGTANSPVTTGDAAGTMENSALIAGDAIAAGRQKRVYLYAAIGGLLGGWAFVTKWFFKSFAKLRDPTSPECWHPKRLFWRLFTPFTSGIVAFVVYLAGTSGSLFVKIDNHSGGFAFSFSFILGYFSDAVLSKMAKWVDDLLGPNSGNSNRGAPETRP